MEWNERNNTENNRPIPCYTISRNQFISQDYAPNKHLKDPGFSNGELFKICQTMTGQNKETIRQQLRALVNGEFKQQPTSTPLSRRRFDKFNPNSAVRMVEKKSPNEYNCRIDENQIEYLSVRAGPRLSVPDMVHTSALKERTFPEKHARRWLPSRQRSATVAPACLPIICQYRRGSSGELVSFQNPKPRSFRDVNFNKHQQFGKWCSISSLYPASLSPGKRRNRLFERRDTVEKLDRSFDSNMQLSECGSPLDLSFVCVSGSEHPPRPSITECAQNGICLKPSVNKARTNLRWKMRKEIVCSIIRNILCLMFLSCLVAAIADGRKFKVWGLVELILVFTLMGIGFVGVLLQILHIVTELKNKGRTVLADLLKQPYDREQFINMLTIRQTAPPYLAVEVTAKKSVVSSDNSSHWSQKSKRMDKTLSYNAWADTSRHVSEINWSKGQMPNLLIVGKDYRLTNERTQQSIEGEVHLFRSESCSESDSSDWKCEYILDVEKGEWFQDAEIFLVYNQHLPVFFRFLTYKFSLFLCFDGLYQLIFQCLSVSVEDYHIQKFLER